jgi:hypothetical protein
MSKFNRFLDVLSTRHLPLVASGKGGFILSGPDGARLSLQEERNAVRFIAVSQGKETSSATAKLVEHLKDAAQETGLSLVATALPLGIAAHQDFLFKARQGQLQAFYAEQGFTGSADNLTYTPERTRRPAPDRGRG